jgi:hypothetical protein
VRLGTPTPPTFILNRFVAEASVQRHPAVLPTRRVAFQCRGWNSLRGLKRALSVQDKSRG